jgi:hypothetical protein
VLTNPRGETAPIPVQSPVQPLFWPVFNLTSGMPADNGAPCGRAYPPK